MSDADHELEPRTERDNRGVVAEIARPDRKLDVSQALKLRLKGWTFEDIARKLGSPASTVKSALARFKTAVDDPDSTRAFRENEAELLDVVAASIVSHMSAPEVIAKASLNNAAFALAKVHEARRLIRGESTANVGIRTTLVLQAHSSGNTGDSVDADGVDEGTS